MGQRLELHEVLKSIMGEHKVYFQPPANVQMTFPCIVYNEESTDTKFASNLPYRFTKRYQATVIDRDPDSVFPSKVRVLPMCLHDRTFAADNLNHFVFTLYF